MFHFTCFYDFHNMMLTLQHEHYRKSYQGTVTTMLLRRLSSDVSKISAENQPSEATQLFSCLCQKSFLHHYYNYECILELKFSITKTKKL